MFELNFRERSRERRWQHDRADDYVLSSSSSADDRFGGRNGRGGGWNNGGGGGLGRGGGMRDYRGGGHMGMGGPDRRAGSRFHGGRREEEAPEWFGETIEQGSSVSVKSPIFLWEWDLYSRKYTRNSL